MDWRNIPSLAALRAFEAAARLESYSAAARELNVTHAAIAQHVRTLEDRFGQPLMARAGRGMAPTQAGAQLAEDLNRGFSEIAAGVRGLDKVQGTGPLCVTTTRTFAENWLMPRLPKFWAAHPDILLAIYTNDDVVDLRYSGCQMAIRYYVSGQPCDNARFLTAGQKVLVGHADLVAQIDSQNDQLAELEKLPWLVDEAYTDFTMWLQRRGVDFDRLKISYLDGNPLVLSGVRAGAGIAAQPLAVVADDVAAGRLKVLLASEEDEAGYYIVTQEGPQPEKVKVFERWLRTQIS